jgi:hypothetical protein
MRNSATIAPATCTIQSPAVFGLPKLNTPHGSTGIKLKVGRARVRPIFVPEVEACEWQIKGTSDPKRYNRRDKSGRITAENPYAHL